MLGKPDLSFYDMKMRPEGLEAVSLYLPVKEDEKITDILVRCWEKEFCIYHAALIVSLTVSNPYPFPHLSNSNHVLTELDLATGESMPLPRHGSAPNHRQLWHFPL